MLKSVMKEIFIILLLSIAILLILGILFYDYIPINQTVPTKEAYVTPNTVKGEIDETISESEKVEVTYEVTDSDLNIYKQSGSYTEGKANPFAMGQTIDETTNTEDDKDTNESTNGNEQKDETNEQTNTFWNDEGIK